MFNSIDFWEKMKTKEVDLAEAVTNICHIMILKHPFITCSHHNKGTEQNNKYNYACIVTLYIVIDFVGRFLYDEVQLGKKQVIVKHCLSLRLISFVLPPSR